MKNNDIWDLVLLPEGDVNGYLKSREIRKIMWKYTKRLVTKGFTQKESIAYKETFYSVFSKDSFTIIMTLVAHFNLELYQMDVKTIFLNSDIDETIYMVQPENFVSGNSKNMICKFKKIHLWIQTSVSIIVFQISSSDYLIWF